MASDRYNYVLTESAEADIDEAFDYIAGELVNPDAASACAYTFTSGFFSPNFSLSISQISLRSLPCFSICFIVL